MQGRTKTATLDFCINSLEIIEILCDVYAVVESYDIDFHRDRGDLTDFEKDMLEALRLTEE